MEHWEKRLKHERDARDGFVKCGNKAPDRPDPPNSLIRVHPILRFNGKIFFQHMEAHGHDFASFEDCKCSRS
jgi:hypothetical protein